VSRPKTGRRPSVWSKNGEEAECLNQRWGGGRVCGPRMARRLSV